MYIETISTRDRTNHMVNLFWQNNFVFSTAYIYNVLSIHRLSEPGTKYFQQNKYLD